MRYVIVDWGFETGVDRLQMMKVGDVNYRPDGKAIYPCGLAEWTKDPDEALTFDTTVAAWEFWRQQSTLVPLRPDGEPNRPLTFFSVSVEPLENHAKNDRQEEAVESAEGLAPVPGEVRDPQRVRRDAVLSDFIKGETGDRQGT